MLIFLSRLWIQIKRRYHWVKESDFEKANVQDNCQQDCQLSIPIVIGPSGKFLSRKNLE